MASLDGLQGGLKELLGAGLSVFFGLWIGPFKRDFVQFQGFDLFPMDSRGNMRILIRVVDLGPGEFNMFSGLCDFGTVHLVQIGISLKGVS